MHIFYAPFRALEQKFADYVFSLRPGPQKRVLVLCPSARVSARLRGLCAEKTGLVSNLFFVTFSQLLSKLDAENPSTAEPLLPADALHDYVLKNLLLSPGFDRYKPGRGFVRALRASLRDLADALADPDVLEEHLQTLTDPRLEAQLPHLRWLVQIYRAYLEKMDSVPAGRSYRAYFDGALASVPNSAYLQSFSEILVYGFCEFTGRQLELFNQLRSQYSVSVFWPYSKHPAFAYGRKFFEANVLGGFASSEELPENWSALAGGEALEHLFSSQSAASCSARARIISAPDPEGEVFFAVKEMLRLHEEEGVPYCSMALTARSLEPYKTLLPAAFEQNGVPLNAVFEFGFSSRPLGVFLNNLFSLLRGGFEREDVLSVVTSPYFKHANSWRYLIGKCLARRDFNQWVDLLNPSLPGYDPEFLHWLEEVKRRLEFLEQPLEWNVLVKAAREFLEQNTDTSRMDGEEKAVWGELTGVFAVLARFGAVSPRAGEGEFLDELFCALQDVRLRQNNIAPRGITAADCASLRGLAFEAVFVLGINEKSFPQAVYEDPILKDGYRRVLRDQLGFWINQKMERFDEERLLFFFTLEAAQSRLYLSFLRSDAEGKPLVPSVYLAEFARAGAMPGADGAQRVSGRLSERLKETELKRLSPKELSLLLAAEGAEPAQYVAASLATEEDAAVLRAARRMACMGAPTEYDGMVQSGEAVFSAQNAQGFSPSALQDLAHCPMKYFLAKGIGLKEPDDVLSRSELAPNARGTAYHEILKDYYSALCKDGQSPDLFPSALRQRLEEALNKHYNAKSYKRFGIYPVIWELILQDMRDKLSDFVVKDAQYLDGFVPSVFETLFEGTFSFAPGLEMKLKGIIDRIDINAQAQTMRVLDYKSGRRGGKDLSADMFKKVILQPFIYLLLAQNEFRTRGFKQDGAALLNINKGYDRQELSAAGFEAVRPRAEKFLALLADLIRGGTFFVSPSSYCEYCPYSSICRKESYRTLQRARHSPQFRALEEAKQ